MDDVVEQGRRDRWGPPRWLRGSALAIALCVGVLAVTRPHLLSATGPAPHPSPAAQPTKRDLPAPLAHNSSQGISIVVRQGDHLERYAAGSGRWPLATLPQGLPDRSAFAYSPRRSGSGPIVAIDQDVLFRASPIRGRAVVPVGRADRVLAVSPMPGRLFVLKPGAAHHRSRLVELEARTGRITDGRPFPGYDETGPWRPANIVVLPGARVLLLTGASHAGRFDLALAWDRSSVASDGASALVRIGSASRLLGVAGSHILTVVDRPDMCVDHGCPITVLTVTREGVQARAVQPPLGWTYETTVAGGERGDPLVVVSRVGDPARVALARLFGDGRLGLVVAGTDGFAGSVRPVGDLEGSVIFAVPRPEGLRLSVVLPGSRSAALLIDLPALQAGAELVCACR